MKVVLWLELIKQLYLCAESARHPKFQAQADGGEGVRGK